MYLVLMDDADRTFKSPEFYSPHTMEKWLKKQRLYGTYLRFVGKPTGRQHINERLSIISVYFD